MIFVWILGAVLLVSLWAVGDQEFRTKVILTVVFLVLWGLVAIPGALYFVFAGQCLWCIVVGYWTFGKDFRK
jgi:hypothetical protein